MVVTGGGGGDWGPKGTYKGEEWGIVSRYRRTLLNAGIITVLYLQACRIHKLGKRRISMAAMMVYSTILKRRLALYINGCKPTHYMDLLIYVFIMLGMGGGGGHWKSALKAMY